MIWKIEILWWFLCRSRDRSTFNQMQSFLLVLWLWSIIDCGRPHEHLQDLVIEDDPWRHSLRPTWKGWLMGARRIVELVSKVQATKSGGVAACWKRFWCIWLELFECNCGLEAPNSREERLAGIPGKEQAVVHHSLSLFSGDSVLVFSIFY